jgi:cytochrome b involved in lipid metabolism
MAKVYDVTEYLDAHPGGHRVLLAKAGQDATEQFETHHNVKTVLAKFEKMVIGHLKGASERPLWEGSDSMETFGDNVVFGKF